MADAAAEDVQSARNFWQAPERAHSKHLSKLENIADSIARKETVGWNVKRLPLLVGR